jgi:hypothetical protein
MHLLSQSTISLRFSSVFHQAWTSRTWRVRPKRSSVHGAFDPTPTCCALALAWGCGGYSLQSVAAWSGERGIATLTDEALIQRLHGAGPFLQAVINELLAGVGEVPCWHGRVLRIADSTSLSKQASKGTDWRVHGVFDLGLGGFSHLELTDGHGGEALDRGKPVAGEIRIGDRG